MDHSIHSKYIENILNEHKHWKIIERMNLASTIPTDFCLLEIKGNEKEDIINKLKKDENIKHISKQKRLENLLKDDNRKEERENQDDEKNQSNQKDETEENILRMSRNKNNRNFKSNGKRNLLNKQQSISPTELLNARILWARGYKGRGIKIAIFDSGMKNLSSIAAPAVSKRRCE